MIENLKTRSFVFFAGLAICVVAIAAISWNALSNLPTYWSKEEYSHGYLIPFIAAFLGWHALSTNKPEISPSWVGIPVLIFSLLLSALSDLAAFEALLNYSFIIALFGVCLTFFGVRFTVIATPALFFLFFAAPLPHIVYGNLSIKMQLISSSFGTGLIRLFGFPVFQDGNVIDLGYMKLQVEEACNGLRYLFPLLSLGYLAAYLLDDKVWKRLVLFLSAIPITILMNSVRIGMVGVTVNLWGEDMAGGVLHIFEGYVVFGLCFALLMAELSLFLLWGKSGRFRDEYLSLPKGKIISGHWNVSTPSLVFLLICILGVSFFYSGVVNNRLENTPVTRDFSSFPLQLGDWSGVSLSLSSTDIETLDLSSYWLGDYREDGATTPPVNLYVAYYKSQRMRSNIHIPLNCIIGGGWQVEGQGKSTVTVGDGVIPVVRLVVSKQGETSIVYYWLQQRGRKMNDPLVAKGFLIWDSIVMHRSDGSLVRVSTPLKDGEKPTDADMRLKAFLNSVDPYINEFVPGK